jgi:ABC-2 type transport system permease protein
MIYLYLFFFEIGHDVFAYKVKYGELDYDLIRPLDSMFLCSFSRLEFPSLFNLILPFNFLSRGMVREQIAFSPLSGAGFITAILLGTFVIYLLNHILTTLSFWLTDFSNSIQLLNSVIKLGLKPLNIYPWILQVIFGFYIPIILTGNLPAEILLGKVTYQKLIILIVGIAILYTFTRILWIKGLKR